MVSCFYLLKMVLKMVIIIIVCIASGPAIADDSKYFNRTAPDFETVLTAEDHERGQYVVDVIGHKEEEEIDKAMVKGGKFEGDMDGISMPGDLTPQSVKRFSQQFDRMLESTRDEKAARNAIRNRYRLWDGNVVPYTLSNQYSSYSRSRIAAAMDEYQRRTCVKFIPRQREIHDDYVHITPDDGCYSMVGRARGKQIVSLDSGCIQKGVIIHELMHTLGFFHEQSRNDRDQHINILYDNIIPGAQDQFQKYSLNKITHLGTAYDYGSIMHYSKRAFSKNGDLTIQTIPVPNVRIGQRSDFSSNDLAKINILYECNNQPGPAPATQPPPTFGPVNPNVNCKDRSRYCPSSSNSWKCTYRYMKKLCPKSCGTCNSVNPPPVIPTTTVVTCENQNILCETWASVNLCNSSAFRSYMTKNCSKACGLC